MRTLVLPTLALPLVLALPAAAEPPAPTRCVVYVAGRTTGTHDLALVNSGIRQRTQEETEITVFSERAPAENGRAWCAERARARCATPGPLGCRFELAAGEPAGWDAAERLDAPPPAPKKGKKAPRRAKKAAGGPKPKP